MRNQEMMKKKETGDHGENLVVEKLRLLGYTALLKPTNHPVFDIDCGCAGGRRFTVQVKTSTAPGTQAWIGLTAVDGAIRDDLYFVVLRLWDHAKQPEFFILTQNELKGAWQKMPITKPNGEQYRRTGHLAWQHLEPYLDRWDTLPN
jgi:hypothetical protein